MDRTEQATPRDLLRAALVIGERLCREAEWSGDGEQCSWSGAQMVDLADPDSPVAVMRLGGDIYGGSAGIAAFLLQLNRASPSATFETTARGALRHAVQSVSTPPEPPAIAYFSGKLGVSYVVSECDVADAPLQEAAGFLLESAREEFRRSPETQRLDIISGAAGAILALLSLDRASPQSRYLDFAAEIGMYVCACAEWTEEYCTWSGSEVAGFASLPLAGYSHGASGMAHALLALYARTGEREFLITARGAYAYEDSLYDPQQNGWLDLRFVDTIEEARVKHQFPVAWCHGAAGIALSRKAALFIDSERECEQRRTLRHAVTATKDTLERVRDYHIYDTTICHGSFGLIGTLAAVSEAFDDQSLEDVCAAAAEGLIARYGNDGSWPCGVPDGSYNPSLMIGIAGIGMTLLRLAKASPLYHLPGLC